MSEVPPTYFCMPGKKVGPVWSKYGFGNASPMVPVHIERLVTEKLMTISDRGFGISRQNLQLKIGSICGQLKIKTPFKDGIPGSDWFLGFKKRNPEISIGNPKNCQLQEQNV